MLLWMDFLMRFVFFFCSHKGCFLFILQNKSNAPSPNCPQVSHATSTGEAGTVCQHLVIHSDWDGKTAGLNFLVLVLSGDL